MYWSLCLEARISMPWISDLYDLDIGYLPWKSDLYAWKIGYLCLDNQISMPRISNVYASATHTFKRFRITFKQKTRTKMQQQTWRVLQFTNGFECHDRSESKPIYKLGTVNKKKTHKIEIGAKLSAMDQSILTNIDQILTNKHKMTKTGLISKGHVHKKKKKCLRLWSA